MTYRYQTICPHCSNRCDRVVDIGREEVCEDCLQDALDWIQGTTPVCVKRLLNKPGWELQTLDGVKNCVVNTSPGFPERKPDCWVKVCGYTLPVYNGEVPQ